MRASTEQINKMEMQLVNKQASWEKVAMIQEDKSNKSVMVTISFLDANKSEIERKNYFIVNQNYDLLMSASPSFAPGKPLNEYREVDLWHMVDLLRTTP